MKYTLAFLFVLTTLSLDAQESQRVISKLDAVTVFEEGASFSRYANLKLKPGNQTLIFYGLPINLNPSSIQIGSSEAIEILSISSGNTPFDQREKPAEYLKLETEIEALFRQKESVSAEIEALKLEAEFLTKNTQLGGDKGYNLAELQQISAFARDQKRKNAIATQSAVNELEALNKKQAALQNQLANLKRPLTLLSGEVIVKIASAQALNTNINLVYSIANNASWNSNYNLYFESLNQNLKLYHKAQVFQSTGEDWDEVKLTLVTGKPSDRINMPILYPRYANIYYPQNNRGARARAMDDVEAISVQSAGVIKEKGYSTNYAAVQQLNQVNRMEYHPQDRQSLKHQSSENVVLRELAIEAKYEYQTSPSLDPSAYLMSKWENWTHHQLLPGAIHIYNQGLFVGSTYSDFKEGSDSLYISLGKDPQIMVKRERVFNQEGKSFLGSDKIIEYQYLISLANRKSDAISIRIFDQVPISQNEAISIKSKLGEGAKFNSKTGTITWQLNLASKAEKSLEFAYEIRYPKDATLNW